MIQRYKLQRHLAKVQGEPMKRAAAFMQAADAVIALGRPWEGAPSDRAGNLAADELPFLSQVAQRDPEYARRVLLKFEEVELLGMSLHESHNEGALLRRQVVDIRRQATIDFAGAEKRAEKLIEQSTYAAAAAFIQLSKSLPPGDKRGSKRLLDRANTILHLPSTRDPGRHKRDLDLRPLLRD